MHFISMSREKLLAQCTDLRAHAGLHSTVHYGKMQGRYILMDSTFLQFVPGTERKLQPEAPREPRVAWCSNGT